MDGDSVVGSDVGVAVVMEVVANGGYVNGREFELTGVIVGIKDILGLRVEEGFLLGFNTSVGLVDGDQVEATVGTIDGMYVDGDKDGSFDG